MNDIFYGENSGSEPTQVYFNGETYHETLPEHLRNDLQERVELVRYANSLSGTADAVLLEYNEGEWTHEEVEEDASKFEQMIKYRQP